MGITFRLDGDVLRFTTTGDVAYAEGTDVLRRGFAAAAAADGAVKWQLLFDIRESAENRSADDLRGVADLVAMQHRLLSGRCAMLAADPLHYGLARMTGVFFEMLGLEARVFTDPAEAAAWLGAS